MTDRYEKLIAKILRQADERENANIRMYGAVDDTVERQIRAMRRLGPALRTLASECYLSGVNLKIELK